MNRTEALKDEDNEDLRLIASHRGTRCHESPDPARKNGHETEKKELVYLVGTSTKTRGGIGYVIKTYFDSTLAEDYELVHIVTHCDGSKLMKLWLFLKALLRFVSPRSLFDGRIAHIHSSTGPGFPRKLIFVFVAHVMARPVIFHIHSGVIREYYEEAGRVLRWMIRWVLRSVDVVIVLTSQWELEVRRIEPRCAEVRVVGNPVDLSKYRPAPKREKRSGYRLLFLGTVLPRKGVYELIESVARLSDEGWDLSVTIAGDQEIEKARQICRERGVGENVHLVGWVDEAEKLDLLRETDALLLPSYYEGLPLCVLEAMACGVPVICSAVGGLTDLIRDDVNGLLIEAANTDQLTEAIRRLLGDADLRDRLALAGRKTVEHEYDLNVVATTLSAIYNDLKR